MAAQDYEEFVNE